MKFPCIESTLDIPIVDLDRNLDLTIRLWINEESLDAIRSHELDRLDAIDKSVKDYVNSLNFKYEVRDIIDFCIKIEKINAVQVLTRFRGNTKFGVVVYTVDFSNDVHG